MNNLLAKIKVFFPLTQLFRFGIVGLMASSIHFLTVVFLVQFLKWEPLVANVGGFFAGFQMSYWGHRLWTFSYTITIHRVALPRLLTLQTLIFLLNESLFYLFLCYHWPYQLALFFTLIILPIFSFIFNKLWVFS